MFQTPSCPALVHDQHPGRGARVAGAQRGVARERARARRVAPREAAGRAQLAPGRLGRRAPPADRHACPRHPGISTVTIQYPIVANPVVDL